MADATVMADATEDGAMMRVIDLAGFGLGRTSPNPCQGGDYSYRLDRQEVIDWIDQVAGNHWNQ